MAVGVVHRLVSTDHNVVDRPLFQRLAKEFEEDRSVVRAVLNESGHQDDRSSERPALRLVQCWA